MNPGALVSKARARVHTVAPRYPRSFFSELVDLLDSAAQLVQLLFVSCNGANFLAPDPGQNVSSYSMVAVLFCWDM